MFSRSEVLSKGDQGFTIVEMAIVMLISGIVFAGFLSGSINQRDREKYNNTVEKLETVQGSLREYFGLYGRYPCPANPEAEPGDADYGEEQCPVDPLPCNPTITCTNVGARDVDEDGTPEDIYIGALPVQTLVDNALFSPITIADGIDGYGMKFTYAVTAEMADQSHDLTNPANVQSGAVVLNDEFNVSLVDPADSSHYIIVSHGEDMVGAHSINGSLMPGCEVSTGGGPVPPVAGWDVGTLGAKVQIENCDDTDALFVKAPYSLVDDDSYFDDIVVFNTAIAERLWRKSTASPEFIYNTNVGNVGVNTQAPTMKLDVNGNIRADNAVQATRGYCHESVGLIADANCLNPVALGGSGMATCPAGQAAKRIENNELVCEPVFTSGIPPFNCPTGQFLKAFSTSGNFTCEIP